MNLTRIGLHRCQSTIGFHRLPQLNHRQCVVAAPAVTHYMQLIDIPLLRRIQHIFSQRCTGDLSAARARLSASWANTLSV